MGIIDSIEMYKKLQEREKEKKKEKESSPKPDLQETEKVKLEERAEPGEKAKLANPGQDSDPEQDREKSSPGQKELLPEDLSPKEAENQFDPTAEKNQPKVRVMDSGNYLLLENLVCSDASGEVMESYNHLYVAKGLKRNDPGYFPVQLKLEQFEGKPSPGGDFLPSFALTCNILLALYQNRSVPECEELLQQYNPPDESSRWHLQNTQVDWFTRLLVHYPYCSEKLAPEENIPRKKNYSFSMELGPPESLSKILQQKKDYPNYFQFIQNLTGLRDLNFLLVLGGYFNKFPRMLFPPKEGQPFREANCRLGCSLKCFSLDIGYRPYYLEEGRMVRSSLPKDEYKK